MNPYGKIFRCKGSFHPQSEEPRYNHVTPGECKRPTLLRLDSTGEISSDDHRSTMTGEKCRRKISPSNCCRMGTLMNSTLFSWSRLSSKKQLVSMSDSTNNFEIINNIAKNMDKLAGESNKGPAKHDLGGTLCYSVPSQPAHPYHCANTFRNKVRGTLGMHSTMNGYNRHMFNRNFPKDSDFGRNPDNRLPYTNHGNNTYCHWKQCHKNRQYPHQNSERCRNKMKETHKNEKNSEKADAAKTCPQNSSSNSSEVKLNSINMLKNILLQNEILNNSKTNVSDIKSQDNKASHLSTRGDTQTEKVVESSEPKLESDEISQTEMKDNSEKVNVEITDWFSMGRSDSVDGTGNVFPLVSVYSTKIQSHSELDDINIGTDCSEKQQIEIVDTGNKKFQDCKASETEKCTSISSPTDLKQTSNTFTKMENSDTDVNSMEKSQVDSICSEKKESTNSDCKDYSFLLFVRNNNKKCRPSVQKRRRSKARMSENQRTRRVSVNIQNANNLDASSDRYENVAKDSKCDQETNSPNTVAFILGFDPNSAGDKNRTRSHSFLVSFSDSDTDSDFGSDEDDDETFSDEQFDDFQFASPLNLNVICSVKKPETTEDSRLKALNMAWKVNIQVKDCKVKPTRDRKVHFAEENKLVEVHPIVAWSYAYQAARKGPWEEYARDRERFKKRVSDVEKIISPVLKIDHRQSVYSKYFSDSS